jgi:hypothetical protein
MAFLTMEMSIAMYSRRRDIIVLVSKYRRRVVTKQMLFQLQEVLQKSERKPSASSGGMNFARGEAMRSAVHSPHSLARRLHPKLLGARHARSRLSPDQGAQIETPPQQNPRSALARNLINLQRHQSVSPKTLLRAQKLVQSQLPDKPALRVVAYPEF